MNFFDLTPYSHIDLGVGLLILVSVISIVMIFVGAYMIDRGKESKNKNLRRVGASLVAVFLVLTLGFATSTFVKANSRSENSKAVNAANKETLKAFASTEYDVNLDKIDLLFAPSEKTKNEYLEVMDFEKVYPSEVGESIATAVDLETLIPYSFKVGKDGSITLIQNGVEVEAKKIQNKDSTE